MRSRIVFRSSRSSSAAAWFSTKARSVAKPVRTSLTWLAGYARTRADRSSRNFSPAASY
jgi:hypothetical protein